MASETPTGTAQGSKFCQIAVPDHPVSTETTGNTFVHLGTWPEGDDAPPPGFPQGLALLRTAGKAGRSKKGGHWGHSDGNRVTTTVGNVVDVIQGAYIAYRSSASSPPGPSLSCTWASSTYTQVGSEDMPIGNGVGSPSDPSFSTASDDNVPYESTDLPAPSGSNPDPYATDTTYTDSKASSGDVVSSTWAQRVLTYTGSAKTPVPYVFSLTYAGSVLSNTVAKVIASTQEAVAVASNTIAVTIVSTQEAVALGNNTTALFVGNSTEGLTVGNSTAAVLIGNCQVAAALIANVNTAPMTTTVNTGASVTTNTGAVTTTTTGVTLTTNIGDVTTSTTGANTTLNVGDVETTTIGVTTTANQGATVTISNGDVLNATTGMTVTTNNGPSVSIFNGPQLTMSNEVQWTIGTEATQLTDQTEFMALLLSLGI